MKWSYMTVTLNKDARDHTLASTAWKAIIQDMTSWMKLAEKATTTLVLKKKSKNIASLT